MFLRREKRRYMKSSKEERISHVPFIARDQIESITYRWSFSEDQQNYESMIKMGSEYEKISSSPVRYAIDRVLNILIMTVHKFSRMSLA